MKSNLVNQIKKNSNLEDQNQCNKKWIHKSTMRIFLNDIQCPPSWFLKENSNVDTNINAININLKANIFLYWKKY